MPFKTRKLKIKVKPAKLVSLFILSLIIWQALLLPVAASAEEITGNARFDAIEKSLGDVSCSYSVKCYVTRGMAWIGYKILQVSSVALFVGGKLFDLSAKLSLNYGAYSRNGGAVAVYKGWTLARDFVNLFFIFAILIISVATILQIPGYGFKQLIFRLVFIAVFINFSFFITQQIIVATNSAALYFYNPYKDMGLATIFTRGLDPQKLIGGYKINAQYLTETGIADPNKLTNEQLVDIAMSLGLPKCQKKLFEKGVLSGGFLTEIHKENMTNMSTADWQICRNEISLAIENNKKVAQQITASLGQNSDSIILSIIITTVGGVIVVLTAAFILLAAAALFMVRTVLLWVLMVLAPLAFFAYILPETKRHWSAWWTRLLKEAFFAPVMMFMFFIVVLIINSGFLETYVLQGNTSKTGDSFVFNYYLVAQYVFLLLLLAISLIVARNMGATGANMAINYGTRARKWAQGQAGRVPARFARRYTAPVAEKIATGEGGVAKTLRRIPGIGVGARAVAGSERQRVSDMEKRLSSMTTDEVKARYESKWLKGRESLMAMTNVLKGRGDLGKLTPAQLKEVHGRMKGLGMDVKDIETHAPTLTAQNPYGSRAPQELQNIEKAVGNQRADQVKDYAKNTEQFTDADVLTNAQKHYGENHWREFDKAAAVNDDAKASAKEFFGSIATFGNTIDEIADKLEAMGNSSAARFLKTADGEKIFRDNIVSSLSDNITSKRYLERGTDTQQQATLGRMSVADINELDYNSLKTKMAGAGRSMDDLFDNMLRAFNPQQIRAIIDKGGNLSSDFMDKLERVGGRGTPSGRSDKATDIGTELDMTYGRDDLRRWIEGTIGKDLLNLKQ